MGILLATRTGNIDKQDDEATFRSSVASTPQMIDGGYKINFISGVIFLLPIALTLYVMYTVSA